MGKKVRSKRFSAPDLGLSPYYKPIKINGTDYYYFTTFNLMGNTFVVRASSSLVT